eukprot:gene10655-7584_t
MISRSSRRVLSAVASKTRLAADPKVGLFVGTFYSANGLVHNYSTSSKAENALITAGVAAVAISYTAKVAYPWWQSYLQNKAAAAANAPPESDSAASAAAGTEEDSKAKSTAEDVSASAKRGDAAKKGAAQKENWFDRMMGARNHYDGGFEDKMTKREAALILGIRESAPVDKVKEAHRRVLLLNHPDRGGSEFLAAKINEAKDLLLKGRA